MKFSALLPVLSLLLFAGCQDTVTESNTSGSTVSDSNTQLQGAWTITKHQGKTSWGSTIDLSYVLDTASLPELSTAKSLTDTGYTVYIANEQLVFNNNDIVTTLSYTGIEDQSTSTYSIAGQYLQIGTTFYTYTIAGNTLTLTATYEGSYDYYSSTKVYQRYTGTLPISNYNKLLSGYQNWRKGE